MRKPTQNIRSSSAAVQRLTLLAVFVSVLIATLLPAGYFLSIYYREIGAMEAEAKSDSFYVSLIASENPALWQYQQHRLQDILDRRPRKDTKESRKVYSLDGALIAESNDNLDPPLMRQTYPILDAGRSVGTIEIGRSLRSILLIVGFVALGSMSLGYAIFYILRVMPIRSVQMAETRTKQYAMELEETNVDLQSFIFSLSHDLRTPLVTMKGFTGELVLALHEHEKALVPFLQQLKEEERMRILERLHYELPETLEFMEMASDKMSCMISGVSKLSQVYQLALRPQAIDMETFMRSQVDRLREAISRRNVTVTIGTLTPLHADRAALEDIVGHLLDNAIKYLLPDRPGRVEISSHADGEGTVISIRDNGRGIAQEDLVKIFGLFRRAGQQSILGEGMGLVYVKALVRRHGGRIWCESEVGSGSVFRFVIPARLPSGS